MINIDFWYNDKIQDITGIDIYFNGLTGRYEGNIYIDEKAVGDYYCSDSVELENTFSHLHFNWD